MFLTPREHPFKNRLQVGEELSQKLKKYKGKNAIVLAIPRGGVEVGAKVAQELNLPLDVIVTRKLGAPGNPELAIGAMGSQGEPVLDEDFINNLGVSQEYLKEEIKGQKKEAKRREKIFRQGKGKLDVAGKVAILVDDGIATGQTVLAAIRMVKKEKPRKIVLASPLAPQYRLAELKKEVDEALVLKTPIDFRAVSQFYQEFLPLSDEDVVKILRRFTKENMKGRQTIKLIVGLGNVGKKYQNNRHNLGFMVLDQLAGQRKISWENNKDLESAVGKISEFIFLKPQIFMNHSGKAVKKVMAEFNLGIGDLGVVHDDLDLPFGKIKMQMGRGSAGHKGVQSIIEEVGEEFFRIRVGVGRPPKGDDPDQYLLSDFSRKELSLLKKTIGYATEVINLALHEGWEKAASQFSSKSLD